MSAVIASANRQPSIGERGPPSRRIELWIASEYHSPHDTMTTTHRSTIWWRWEMVVTMHNCLRGEGKATASIHSKCKHKWMNSDSRFKRCGKGIKSKFACLLLLHDAMKTGASRFAFVFPFCNHTNSVWAHTHSMCVLHHTHFHVQKLITFAFASLCLPFSFLFFLLNSLPSPPWLSSIAPRLFVCLLACFTWTIIFVCAEYVVLKSGFKQAGKKWEKVRGRWYNEMMWYNALNKYKCCCRTACDESSCCVVWRQAEVRVEVSKIGESD